MRATELIAELESQVKEHGDLPVRVAVPMEPGALVYVSSEDIDVDIDIDADGKMIEVVGGRVKDKPIGLQPSKPWGNPWDAKPPAPTE